MAPGLPPSYALLQNEVPEDRCTLRIAREMLWDLQIPGIPRDPTRTEQTKCSVLTVPQHLTLIKFSSLF
jgi:hypothetical protein